MLFKLDAAQRHVYLRNHINLRAAALWTPQELDAAHFNDWTDLVDYFIYHAVSLNTSVAFSDAKTLLKLDPSMADYIYAVSFHLDSSTGIIDDENGRIYMHSDLIKSYILHIILENWKKFGANRDLFILESYSMIYVRISPDSNIIERLESFFT